MTDQELKDLVAGLAIQSAKTEEELRILTKETNQQIKETTAQMNKTDEKLHKMGIFTKGMNERVEGIAKSSGEIAQEFFYSSLAKKKQLAGIEFDFIDNNIYREAKDKHHEMDIFLENGNSVAIVEVKSKVREKDLEQLQKIVDNFYNFHPKLKSMKIIPAIAGMTFSKDLQHKALQKGFVVLTQKGDHMEQIYT